MPTAIATSTFYRPAAKRSRSGGDWFDVIAIDAHNTLFVIGDVADHGARTTGEMIRARALLQSHAIHERSTGAIAASVSATMVRFSDTFATACIMMFNAEERAIAWTNAGHPYPLHIAGNGDVSFLHGTHGPPLGVARTPIRYSESRRTFAPGETLVLYTDGLIERRNESIDDGLHRLESAARSAPDRTRLAQHLYRTLLPGEVHADDVAILVATVLPDSAPRQ